MNRAEFGEWLNAYKLAWESGDPGKAAALFTPDVVYEETPFDEPMRGLEAIRR